MSKFKRVSGIVAALSAAAVLLSFAACSRDGDDNGDGDVTEPPPPDEDEWAGELFPIEGVPGAGISMTPGEVNTHGNTAGNINNFGIAAMQGDWIFYANHLGIFRVRQDGSDELQISNIGAFGLNVVGDWIYFINQRTRDEWDVYRMKTNGTEVELLLADTIARFLHVHDGWIYFSAGGSDGGHIWRMTVEGTDAQQLNSHDSEFLNIAGRWIYYANADDDWRIWRMRSDDGSGIRRVNNDDSEYVNVVGEWVFYAYDSDDEEDSRSNMNIFRFHREHTQEQPIRVNGDISTEINVVGDWIFYVNNDNNGFIYRIDIYGDNRARMNSHDSMNISVVGNWIYYNVRLDTNDVAIFRMRLDGSDNERVI
jgi:hypothetical protein